VLNKSDLVAGPEVAALSKEVGQITADPVCAVSAKSGDGCADLKQLMEEALWGRAVDVHDAAIALMAEHRESLDRAIDSLGRAEELASTSAENLESIELVAAELHSAADALAVLVGADDTEDLLDRIFSRFCIGK
jgi:tRNA modification GTPase